MAPEAELVGAKIDFVMWDVRRHAQRSDNMPNRCVICFEFTGVPPEKAKHWLVFDDQGTDLCYVDPGFDVSLYVEAEFGDSVLVWRGERRLTEAMESGRINLHGDFSLAKNAAERLSINARRPLLSA